MARKKHSPEQIVAILRQIEVEVANHKPTGQACREAGITEQTYYRWRKEYGGLKLEQARRMKQLEKENARLRRLVTDLSLEKQVLEGGGGGKLLSPERRRCAVEHAREQHRLSERRACRLLGQWRGTQRYITTQRDDEDGLTRAIVQLASQYGRYGYRRITAVLQRAGWNVGRDRVQRIWRREGLKVPAKQKPRGRLWLNDGSCVRLRPEHAEPCMELRLCQRLHPRWTYPSAADADRRVHPEVSGTAGGTTAEQLRSDRNVGGRDAGARSAGAHPLGQWARVRGAEAAAVAIGRGSQDAVHRTRQSLGERLLRELQREAAG